jgi:hypothetical protein
MVEIEPLYTKAETAYIAWFQAMMVKYRADMDKRGKGNDHYPTQEERESKIFAQNIFHDYAYMSAIVENLIKGRGYE